MGKTTTETLGRGKIDQKYINHIEKRLSLSGGTMINEMAADLALKFGKWNTAKTKASDAGFQLQDDIANKRIVGNEPVKAEFTKIKIARKDADELRRTENHNYLKIILQYIKEAYGDERREILNEPNSRLVGYGDRIEIDKKAHLHKIW